MRLIDADALKRERFTHLIRFWDGKVLYSKMIDEQPTIDAEPVKHGRWLLDGRCSECLANPLTTHKTYCPNCGAKMDLEV